MKSLNMLHLELDGASINGTYDIVIDGAVDDVKSASNWSYNNKFESYDTLAAWRWLWLCRSACWLC